MANEGEKLSVATGKGSPPVPLKIGLGRSVTSESLIEIGSLRGDLTDLTCDPLTNIAIGWRSYQIGDRSQLYSQL